MSLPPWRRHRGCSWILWYVRWNVGRCSEHELQRRNVHCFQRFLVDTTSGLVRSIPIVHSPTLWLLSAGGVLALCQHGGIFHVGLLVFPSSIVTQSKSSVCCLLAFYGWRCCKASLNHLVVVGYIVSRVECACFVVAMVDHVPFWPSSIKD
jgi:hypothetical protein